MLENEHYQVIKTYSFSIFFYENFEHVAEKICYL